MTEAVQKLGDQDITIPPEQGGGEQISMGISIIDMNNTNKPSIITTTDSKKDPDEKSLNSAEYTAQELKFREKELEKEKTEIKEEKEKEINIDIEKDKDKDKDNIKDKDRNKDKDKNKEINSVKDKEFLIERERHMRKEVDEYYNETERQKKKYLKDSMMYLYSNDPQLQKIIKKVEKKIVIITLIGILLGFCSGINHFIIYKSKDGISLTTFILSILFFAINALLFSGLKIGLLNDPNLSKAFRMFVVLQCGLLLSSSFFYFISAIFSFSRINNRFDSIFLKLIIYLFILGMLLLLYPALKYSIFLGFESLLILANKKTEYVKLIEEEKEKSNKNDVSNSNSNNSIDKSSGFVVNHNTQKNPKEIDENEKIYNFYNYLDKFHASVSTDREDHLP